MKSKVFILITLPLVIFAAEWQSLNGPPAGRADDLTIGKHLGQYYIYAADQTHKLYKSENEGEFWDSIVTHQYVTNPTCVITDPNEAWTVYVGEVPESPNNHCVWKSTDGGLSWNYKDEGITNTHPLCFAMDPDYPDTILLGCEQDDSYPEMFKTTDGGTDWSALNGCPDVTVNEIGIRPSDPRGQELVIATDDGIYYTSNGGTNWFLKLAKSNMTSVSYANQFVVYAGSNDLNGGLFKSTDGGSTWDINPIGDFSWVRAVAAVSPNEVYIAANTDSDGSGIYRTTNWGSNWTYYGREHGLFCNDSILEILIDPDYSNTHRIYVAGNWAIFQFDVSSGDWQELNKGFPLDTIPHFDVVNNYIYAAGFHRRYRPDTILAIYRTCNGGQDWTCIEGYAYEIFESCVYKIYNELHPVPTHMHYPAPSLVAINPNNTSTFFFTGKIEFDMSPDIQRSQTIYKSTDAGVHWERSFWGGECCTRKCYDIAISSLDPNIIFASYARDIPPGHDNIRIKYTTNCGGTWYTYTDGLPNEVETGDFYAVAIAPQNTNIVFAGSEMKGVFKSTDRGEPWEQTGLDSDTVRTLAIDQDFTSVVYAGISTAISSVLKKTIDFGDSWFDANEGLNHTYVTDIEIDPEEPTIVYLLGQSDGQSTTNHCYLTVDRAGKWFEITDGLPDYTYDIEIDPDNPEKMHSSTEAGLYYYEPDFNKSLVSSSDEATFANNGRKLIRIEDTYEFWATYESGGVIFAVHTTDMGQSWSKKMEIGKGYNPAISIGDGVSEPVPCLVWLAKDQQENQDIIYFSRYINNEQWTAPAQIKISQPGVDFGPPSFVIDNSNYGHLVYVDGSSIKYTNFNIYNPNPTASETVGNGDSPCIGFMTGLTEPPIHVTWEDNSVIRYRARTMFGWGTTDIVSSSDSQNPSLEIGGTNVYVVWERNRNIYWRYAVYTGGEHYWSRYSRVDDTSDPSVYPVLTGGYTCAWVDQVLGSSEVYFSHYDPEQGGWIEPISVSTSSDELYSNYPHIVHKQTEHATKVYFIWTEGSETLLPPTAPAYDIIFKEYVLWNRDGSQVQALPFYIADGGEENASPFNLHRQGYLQYGTEPYKRIDYDAEYLEYEFANLNPGRLYGLGAYLYQRGHPNLPISAKVDNYQTGAIDLPPDTLIILRYMLPTMLYEDSTINVKIFGNNAVSAILVLYEYEIESNRGGPQSSQSLPDQAGVLALSILPNPAKENIGVRYTLPMTTNVKLTLFDVTGRVIEHIVNDNQVSGTFRKSFSNANLSQGVYFVRLKTDDQSLVEKVVFLK